MKVVSCHKYTLEDLNLYLENDFLLDKLNIYNEDKDFTSHAWLNNIPAKRLIYSDVYGEFLKTTGKKILDVGGGFCGLSRELIKNHDYTLIDILAHDNPQKIKELEKKVGQFWEGIDWLDFEINTKYDAVIANDIFPNVDQRLSSFIDKFKDYTNTFIITITCYDKAASYKVKRIDADEIFTIVPWDNSITSLVLQKAINNSNFSLNNDQGGSLFSNGRVVYKLILENE